MADTDNTDLLRTPLYDMHLARGAKFGSFAGYEMPLFYPAGIIEEHKHTRAHAGLFDISHMMHVEITGNDAVRLVERLCPLEASSQNTGQARYTFLLNDNAGIIDDLIVTRLGKNRFLMVCNAGCADKDWQHISTIGAGLDAEIKRIPRGFIALQGPRAETVLRDVTLNVASLEFMTAMEIDDMFVSRTGYTGEDGFEIAMPPEHVSNFAEKLLSHDSVLPIGLGARDSLRLEAGLSLYGQDLNDETTPMEAGLLWAIPKALREGGDFVGAKALASAIANGRKRKRIGLVPEGKAPVRAGATIRDTSGTTLGSVTSGGFGPSVGHPVALGMISTNSDETSLVAEVRGREIPLTLAKLPFIQHAYKN